MHLSWQEGMQYYAPYDRGEIMLIISVLSEELFVIHIYYSPDIMPDYLLIGMASVDDRHYEVIADKVESFLRSKEGVAAIDMINRKAETDDQYIIDRFLDKAKNNSNSEPEKDIFIEGTIFSLN